MLCTSFKCASGQLMFEWAIILFVSIWVFLYEYDVLSYGSNINWILHHVSNGNLFITCIPFKYVAVLAKEHVSLHYQSIVPKSFCIYSCCIYGIVPIHRNILIFHWLQIVKCKTRFLISLKNLFTIKMCTFLSHHLFSHGGSRTCSSCQRIIQRCLHSYFSC